MFKLALAIIFQAVFYVNCKVEWGSDTKTFSHAIKGAYCNANQETELFSRQQGPGVITEQWFTGNKCLGPNTIIRYYIDDNSTPYIEMNLYMGHGIGFVTRTEEKTNATVSEMVGNPDDPVIGEDMGIPWGTRRIGHTAIGGGVYNTIRMPFKKSIRVTFETPQTGYYWYIIRGAQNYPIVVGDLVLPQNAMLRLHKIENYVIKPIEYAVLASSSNKSGLLYQVTLATASSNFQYLEACFRALIDDDDVQYLSSGTEDFFLSAYYYSAGIFHTDQSGLTFFEKPGTMSAYKFFEDDPVMFSKAFKLIWRCGEARDNACFKLSNTNCQVKDADGDCKQSPGTLESPQVTTMTSYVWTYEW